MKKSLTKKEYLLLASLLFGMFFGAGNLIFPVSMGQLAGKNVIPAALGFCITGAGLPLLGIAAMGISKCNGLFEMSSKVGKGFGLFFSTTLYLAIGPLFAIPRNAATSFQVGFSSLIPAESKQLFLLLFSIVFFGIVLYFSLRPSGIIVWIGKMLNPVFLLLLSVLIIAVFFLPMGSIGGSVNEKYVSGAFTSGMLDGYNTLDVLASLAFGIIVVNNVKNLGIDNPKKISSTTVKAGFFSVLAMALIYISLAIAGSTSLFVMDVAEDGGSALNAIARHYFGNFSLVLGLTITFACLKTSIGLVTAFSETFAEITKISYKTYAIACTLFSFALSNVGLNNIIEFSVPVLIFLYPLAIVLTLLCIIDGYFKLKQLVFTTTMGFTIIAALFDLINALPSFMKSSPIIQYLIGFSKKLPLSNYSMAWTAFAITGFVVGFVLSKFKAE